MELVLLYRGMLASDLEEVRASGVFRATRHGGNVASTDISTARHWAGQRGEEGSPAVVVRFEAPVDAVQADEWFKDDYRFVRDFRPVALQIVEEDITGPMHEGVERANDSLASDSAVRTAALSAFESLPYSLQRQVENFLHGVVVGEVQSLEQHADTLWDLYEPVRELVRRHGAAITLYRGEPVVKPSIARRFLSWTPSRKMATLFAPRRGYEVLSAEVDVDDVVAVLVSPHNKGYIEYLVRDRKSYHESGQRLPLMGRVDFDMPYDGFTLELAQSMLTRLERELAAVGGRMLQSYVNEEQETAMAYVLVPPTVEIDENDSTFLGEFEVQYLEPYTRLEESARRRPAQTRLSALRAFVRKELCAHL